MSTEDRLLSSIPTNQHPHTKYKGIKALLPIVKQKP
jgi:hypothetical protein